MATQGDIGSELSWTNGNAGYLLAQIVESSNDSIISTTMGGVVTSWNSSAQRMFGYDAAEMVGRHISILVPADLAKAEQDLMGRLRAGEKIENCETRRRHRDGHEVLVSLSAAPVRDEDGEIVAISRIARDITEHAEAEMQRLKLQQELAHVARLTAMGQMSAAIAHELNQPLTAVTNYVKAAQRLLSDPTPEQIEKARDAMERAAGQTLRAGSIIRYLRDFMEKRESGKKPEDLNQVVREAITLTFVGALQSDVMAETILDPALPLVEMDKVQIQQVLVNLIRNSVEAMAETAIRKLSITTRYRAPDTAEILLRDSGPGLPPEVRERLFQPFVTTKENGMGIGLKICQSTIQAHHGAIRVVPEIRQGAAFEILLPLTQPADDGV